MKKKNPEELKTLSERLTYIREALGYPLNTFARKLGVSKTAYAQTEAGGDPSYKLTTNLSKTFPISLDWVVRGVGQPFFEDIKPHIYHEGEGLTKVDTAPDPAAAERFKDIREALGFSQAHMASELGISRDVVSYIERGKSTINFYVLKTLEKLKVNANYIVYGKGSMFLQRKPIEIKEEEHWSY